MGKELSLFYRGICMEQREEQPASIHYYYQLQDRKLAIDSL